LGWRRLGVSIGFVVLHHVPYVCHQLPRRGHHRDVVPLAFGKPTIVSPVGGISEFLKDREEVIFSKGGDVRALAGNIIKLINDKKLQEKLARNAAKKNSTFLWGNAASKYVNLINKAGNVKK